jgi:hypothetical protein
VEWRLKVVKSHRPLPVRDLLLWKEFYSFLPRAALMTDYVVAALRRCRLQLPVLAHVR